MTIPPDDREVVSKTRKTDVDKLKDGNSNDTWELVVEKYSEMLSRAAIRNFHISPHDADDIVQDTWDKVHDFFRIDRKPFYWRDGTPSFRPFLKLLLFQSFIEVYRKEHVPRNTEPAPELAREEDGSGQPKAALQRRFVPFGDLATDAGHCLEPADDRNEDLERLYSLLADRDELKSLLYEYWPHGSVTETDERRIEFFCRVYGDGQPRKVAGPELQFNADPQWHEAISIVGQAAVLAIEDLAPTLAYLFSIEDIPPPEATLARI